MVAYGQILPRARDRHPRRAAPSTSTRSLLPRYRGAAPIQWAIVNGESGDGRHHHADRRGPRHRAHAARARARRSAPRRRRPSSRRGWRALGRASCCSRRSPAWRAGTLAAASRRTTRAATLAPILAKEDGRIDWTLPADAIARRVRGFHPWPGTFTALGGRRAQGAARARPERRRPRRRPGTVVGRRPRRARASRAATGTRLRLLEVQPESRRADARGRLRRRRAPRARRAARLTRRCHRRPPPRLPRSSATSSAAGATARRAPGRAATWRRSTARDRGVPARARAGHAAPPRRARPRARARSSTRPLARARRARAQRPAAGRATRSCTCACPTARRSRSRSTSRARRRRAAAGFVNAVLRRLAREGPPPAPDPGARPAAAG